MSLGRLWVRLSLCAVWVELGYAEILDEALDEVEADEWIDSIVEVVFCIMGGIGRGWCRTGAAVTVEPDRSDVEPIVALVLSVVTTVEGMLVSGSCAGCRRRYFER